MGIKVKGEHRLMVFKITVQTKLRGPNKEQGKGDRRTFDKMKRNDVYFSKKVN